MYCLLLLPLQGTLRGQMPTKANIIAGLKWLAEGAQPGDVLFFSYSGHGCQEEDPEVSLIICSFRTKALLDARRKSLRGGIVADLRLVADLVLDVGDARAL